MNKHARLRIHIAPLGFESDRIVLPAIKLKADKVWILIHNNPKKTKAKLYLEDIKARLQKERIEFDIKELDRLNLLSIIKSVKSIASEEKDNTYYVNVSSGSKIQAIAGMMACMIFKEYCPIPYYVEPKKYEKPSEAPQSSGIRDIIQLPEYTIQKPEPILIKALDIAQQNNNLNKKTLAKLAIENNLIDSKNDKVTQSDYAKLDHHIIKPLEEKWKFIKVTQIGTNHRISLTDTGEDVCKFLI